MGVKILGLSMSYIRYNSGMLHGLTSEARCILTFYNGLVSEARYILVLKIRVHKQCHVNKFSTATSTCMLWTHRHAQFPSHIQRAVH